MALLHDISIYHFAMAPFFLSFFLHINIICIYIYMYTYIYIYVYIYIYIHIIFMCRKKERKKGAIAK